MSNAPGADSVKQIVKIAARLKGPALTGNNPREISTASGSEHRYLLTSWIDKQGQAEISTASDSEQRYFYST